MKINKFEDIIAWQRAQDHAVLIYRCFTSLTDYAFKNQICKAVVSVSNNIAEGFDRKGDRELKQFLHIALASASEVRSMIYLAYRLNYIKDEERSTLLKKT